MPASGRSWWPSVCARGPRRKELNPIGVRRPVFTARRRPCRCKASISLGGKPPCDQSDGFCAAYRPSTHPPRRVAGRRRRVGATGVETSPSHRHSSRVTRCYRVTCKRSLATHPTVQPARSRRTRRIGYGPQSGNELPVVNYLRDSTGSILARTLGTLLSMERPTRRRYWQRALMWVSATDLPRSARQRPHGRLSILCFSRRWLQGVRRRAVHDALCRRSRATRSGADRPRLDYARCHRPLRLLADRAYCAKASTG